MRRDAGRGRGVAERRGRLAGRAPRSRRRRPSSARGSRPRRRRPWRPRGRGVGHVAPHHLDPVAPRLVVELGRVAGEAADPVAGVEELGHEPAADVAGRAGHEDGGHRGLPTPCRLDTVGARLPPPRMAAAARARRGAGPGTGSRRGAGRGGRMRPVPLRPDDGGDPERVRRPRSVGGCPFTLGHETAGRVAPAGRGRDRPGRGRRGRAHLAELVRPLPGAAWPAGTSACPSGDAGRGVRPRRRPGRLRRRARARGAPARRARPPLGRTAHRRRRDLAPRGAPGPARARARARPSW